MRTLIIGLDAFDPKLFERLIERGGLPHLRKYAAAGKYARLRVSNPAQSEVSWTSIATGLNPGGHGMFDFVHRDPASYALSVSLLPTKKELFGIQFVPPFTARTIFDQAALSGYPATALWWPGMFPARLQSPVRTIPGLGAPDIQGRLGVGSAFTVDPDELGQGPSLRSTAKKTPVEGLQWRGKDRYRGRLKGPGQQKGEQIRDISLEFELEILDDQRGRLSWAKGALDLLVGEWSPIVELSFRTGLFYSLRAITRVILTHTRPIPRLYFLPLQIHPLHSIWPYATPPGFVRQTWEKAGPFLTLGWPQDTTGLEEGWIDDAQFNELCKTIVAERERVLLYHLQNFREGVFAIVFDSLDRLQHMFWRDQPEAIEAWYARMDALVGRAEAAFLKPGASTPPNGRSDRILILSDHGFAPFDTKVHLNRWLEERGYLARTGGAPLLRSTGEPRSGEPRTWGEQEYNLHQADWSKTQAYAIGLNSVYLNVQGREGQGSLPPGEVENLCRRLQEDLLAWRGSDGRPVVQQVYPQEEAFEGPYSQHGPDLLIGYTPGYRASAQTGLGAWTDHPLEANQDHWSGDHCIAPESVPGVLFSNGDLQNFPQPSYRDIPALAIGMEVDHPNLPPPAPPSPRLDPEDQKVVEERLKSLGYL